MEELSELQRVRDAFYFLKGFVYGATNHEGLRGQLARELETLYVPARKHVEKEGAS